jgi:hypothetical protein
MSEPAACCAAPDAASASVCVLCAKPVCARCAAVVNGKKTCGPCRDSVLAEVARENAGGEPLALPAAAGLAAALACGAAWAAIADLTGSEIGFAAVGVGWSVAQAVRWAAGGRRGAALRRLGTGLALLGLVLGKYLMVATAVRHVAAKRAAGELPGFFDPKIAGFFVAGAAHWFGFFDLIWAFLAYMAVARVLAPARIVIGRGNPAPAP